MLLSQNLVPLLFVASIPTYVLFRFLIFNHSSYTSLRSFVAYVDNTGTLLITRMPCTVAVINRSKQELKLMQNFFPSSIKLWNMLSQK